jgi:SAM-dependent methyltransferase
MQDYQARVATERLKFDNCVDVHKLPDIFHYWSNRHVLPKLQALGLNSIEQFFLQFLEEQLCMEPARPKRFVSIGSGNCDYELGLARSLRAKGIGGFIIECVDLNPAMLERGRLAAAESGLEAFLSFIPADFNAWKPPQLYDVVIANQSLHHVVNLEGLFAQIGRCLRPAGVFIISDMIGRNGHQRWPEALDIVHEFWRKLPPSYRFNRRLNRYEELFRDWDCSTEGFEGIRAGDILPLLVSSFHFRFFFPFANVIDPFIDRSFGFNFKMHEQWDRDFIDAVHLRDEEEMNAGRVKPTHMLAALSTQEVGSESTRAI